MKIKSVLDNILSSTNLNDAFLQVRRNKGAAGVDGMFIDEADRYIREHRTDLIQSIRQRQYQPQPVWRVEIPKPTGGVRLLVIPTVIDRVIQQAISQVITPIFDRDFHEKGPNINLGSLATLEDITDNPLNLKFEELDAAQLAATLSDVAVAIINTNFATDAGLSLKDAIFVDADYPDQLNELYKNVVAATAATKNNESSLRVVELYQTEAVAQAIYDLSNGGDKAIWEGGPVLGQQQLLPNFAFLITVELADRMIYRPVPHSEFIMSQ